MEKLKIGDKVYFKKHAQWSNDISFRFDEVVRLTKTQAVLLSGVKLINEPIISGFDKSISYRVFGSPYEPDWRILTPEILEEQKQEEYRRVVVKWFDGKSFNEKEKFLIYDLFNENIASQ